MNRVDVGRVILESIAAVLVVVLVDVCMAGIMLFTNAKEDELVHADAIVVLAGEHDGREDYALQLARDGWAPTVVLSNPYLPGDQVMERVCRPTAGVEVICGNPSSVDTRGEADMVRRLAQQRSWTKIIVVTWRYHIPRARLVFRQCFSDQRGATALRAMPRQYPYSLLQWEFMYFYQFAGFAKAVLQGSCA
jgi:uncharacterized SAM-binding protein YcdF (DUF218 family)